MDKECIKSLIEQKKIIEDAIESYRASSSLEIIGKINEHIKMFGEFSVIHQGIITTFRYEVK